jgi:O-antigen ligase
MTLGYVGGTSSLTLALASILLLSVCTVKFISVLGGHPSKWGLVLSVQLGYVAWLVVLVYTSTLAENSIHYAWVFAGFVFVCLLTYDLPRDRWIETFLLFSLTGVVSATWGLVEFVITQERANGPIVDPSLWGAICNLFFFGTVSIFLTTDRYRYLLGLLLFLFATASFAAYSRVGTVTFFLALGFVVLVMGTQRDLRKRVGVLVAVVAIAFSAVHFHANLEEASQHDEGYTLDVEEYGWSQRFSMWRAGFEIFQERPVLGTGPGTYKIHYPRYRSSEELRNFGNFVHNDYIQFLAEGGPLLLLFLLALVAVLARSLLVGIFSVVRGETSAREPMLLAVALGVPLVQALMNFPLYIVQVQLVMGLLFARFISAGGFLIEGKLALASPRLSQVALGGVAIVATMILVFDAVSSDLVLDHDAIPIVRDIGDDSDAYLDTMRFLSAVRSRNSLNRFAMATIYRTSFDATQDTAARRSLGVATALEYQAGLSLNPYHMNVRGYYAEFLVQNPWLVGMEGIEETPEALYRDGLAIYPVYIESHMALASYLMNAGRSDEGYRVLVEGALPWANLRHGEYYSERLRLLRWLLREARARNDEAVLRELLEVI